MNPKISIIVPVFNVETYIRKCINSILDQTFSNFELILVNDGSSDKSGNICDQYVKQDSRVKVIHQRNKGVSAARNNGLAIAKGEYIGFVDSDDYIHERMYEILFEKAKLFDSDITVCDFLKVNQENVQPVTPLKVNDQITNFSNIEALYQLFFIKKGYVTNSGNNVIWVIVWNKLYKRTLFENIRFNEGRICEDEYIIHKLLYKSNKITYVSSELYYYLQRNNSIIHSPFSLKRVDKVYALKERADFFKNINQEDLYYKSLKSYLDAFFWNYYKVKFEIPGVRTELHKLKKTFNHSLYDLMKNPYISWQQKMVLLVFFVNPNIYEKYAF